MKKLQHVLFATGLAVLLGLGMVGDSWGQSTFTKYGPVAGIQKSTGATYVNTAAASSDVIGLWTGCTGTNFLRGDGACASPAGGVTGLANPTGTIGLTAVNGAATTALRSDGAPALSQAIAPTWTGLHTFSNGATGFVVQDAAAGTNLKNTQVNVSGAGAFQITSATDAAPATAVTNLLSGSRTATAWNTLSFGNTTDNPAYTFLGSGAGTVNGIWTYSLSPLFNAGFNGSASVAGGVQGILTNSAANTSGFAGYRANDDTTNVMIGITSSIYSGAVFTGGPTGQQIFIGNTNVFGGSPAVIPLCLATNAIARLCIAGAGTVQNYEPSFGAAALRNTATYETGSFTATLTGMTTTVTGTVNYTRVGNMITLYAGAAITGTSNTTAMNMTGIPAAITPAGNPKVPCTAITDNGLGDKAAQCFILASNQIAFSLLNLATGAYSGAFTASGSKGLTGGFSVTYSLQ